MTAAKYSPRQMIEHLVAIPTVSADSNLALIDFVKDYLAEHGIDSRLTFDETKRKANLFASIGPEVPGGVVLSGHTDVVPVADQQWDSDPFTATLRDGRLYGRGTADMKSFIAIALALVPEFQAADLRVPIHLALSYDEELGCLGVPGLLADIAEAVPRPAAAIIGEPTSMRLANSHKGTFGFRTTFIGKDGHSSDSIHTLNAITCAAEFIGFLADMAAELRDSGPFDERFEPPHTTCNVGMIDGGTAFNIVARQCRVTWEFRPIPGVDAAAVQAHVESFLTEDLLPCMRKRFSGSAIETERFCAVPPLVSDADSPAEALVRMPTGSNSTTTAAFGTEGGLFQQAGIPAVVCGPGDIAQAHQPNEYIPLDQVEVCAAFLRALMTWASS